METGTETTRRLSNESIEQEILINRLLRKTVEQQTIIDRLERKVAKLLVKLKGRQIIRRFIAWMRAYYS